MKYFLGVFVWLVALVVLAAAKGGCLSNPKAAPIALAIVVIGPPLFYPVAYYLFSPQAGDKPFVKELAEMWGPFWAAVSGVALILYDKQLFVS